MRKRFVGFCLCVIAGIVCAQTVEEDHPQLELIDEDDQPVITIRKPDAQKEIIEKRDESGELRSIKVDTGATTYYMLPKKSLGSEFDDASSRYRPAMWKIHEFDTSGQTQQTSSDDITVDYTADAPEPPSAPQ